MLTDRLARAQAGWQAAEERLYSLAMVDPKSYQQVTALVGALLEALRAEAERTEQLLDLAERPDSLLAVLAERRPASVSETTLLGAALAIRARELAGAEAAAERARMIAAARAEGRDWVRLGGPAELTALVEERRVELHLPSGISLVAGVDPWSGEDPYFLESIPADPGGQRRAERFRDRAQWRAEYERWREDVSTLTIEADTVSDSE